MEGKNSRLNNNTNLVIDRISDLPDYILGHILSFLPTNNAVATSILSKRWKFAWVTVHSLDFYNFVEEKEEDNRNKEKEEEIVEFVRFVNRVLLLNDGGSLIKFSLTCCPLSISPQIISWINTAITRNVHELNLCVGDIDLPTSLFSCDSLRSLDLDGFISIYDTTTVCLPKLESLKFDRVFFKSEEACEKLISGCPIVQYLNLHILQIDADDDFTCIISSASLRRLEIFFEFTSKLKLKASSLEYLQLHGYISEIFVEKSLSFLGQADLEITFDKHRFPSNSIVEAVRAFDCAKFLTLSTHVMRALGRATITLSTEFKRLVKLVARTFSCCIQDFIQNSENLEDLILIQNSFWPVTSDLHDHSRWTALVEVPKCLSNSLKRVRLDGYKGLEDEREMVHYMLENGSVLEVMQICCSSKEDGEKLELLQEICEFPKKSPACKVQFSVWPTKREFKLLH